MYPQGNQPPQQPQAAAQPADQGDQGDDMTQQSGLRQVSDIGFNQDVQNILLSRIQTLTPEEGKALDTAISPQTLPVFLKILPELKPLFDMMANNGSQNYVSTPQPGAAGAGAGAGDDEEEEDEQQNPLVSQGLVG